MCKTADDLKISSQNDTRICWLVHILTVMMPPSGSLSRSTHLLQPTTAYACVTNTYQTLSEGFYFGLDYSKEKRGGGMQTVHSRFTAQDIPPKQYSWNTAIYCIDPKIQPASYLNDWSLIRGYVDHQAQERIESISVFTASTPPLEYKHYFILTLLKKKN